MWRKKRQKRKTCVLLKMLYDSATTYKNKNIEKKIIMDHDSPAIKKIDITQKSTTIADLGKTPKKLKKMAEADEWTPHFLLENQSVDEMVELLDGSLNNPCYNFLHKLVSIKQQGYKSQDRQKNLFDKNKFISVDGIFDLLKTSMLICFYCSLPVKLVYSHARDPKQWSLEKSR